MFYEGYMSRVHSCLYTREGENFSNKQVVENIKNYLDKETKDLTAYKLKVDNEV